MSNDFLSIKKHEQRIKDWENIMPQKFDDWLKELPAQLQQKLDFSLDSTIPLEKEYMRTTMRNKIKATKNPKVSDFQDEIDCIIYYVSDVLIKNAPLKLIRVGRGVEAVNDDSSSAPMTNKIFSLSKADPEEGYNNSQNYLYDFCSKQLVGFEITASRKNKIKDDYALAIRLDDNYQYFLLHKTDTNPLPQIKTLLEEYFSTRDNPPKLSYYRDNKDYFIIEMSDDYCFHFKFKKGNRVKELIHKMAEKDYSGNLNKKEIAQCQSTTEFWGDQDNNMDYMNEALWLLEYIAPKLTDLIAIIDLKNGDEILPKNKDIHNSIS